MHKKNIIISGGSKGLGRELVDKFSKKGFNVINLSRTVIKNSRNNITNYSVDLSSEKKTINLNILYL